MTTRGFLLGKFMPPHRGHLLLAKTAQRLVDEMTVLVCSTDDEPIPGVLRFTWMKQSLPDVSVLHLHRDMPQEPDDHPDFWRLWREAVKEFHPAPIDFVFGSEVYVFRLAEELTAKPWVIDPERLAAPVSGSAIRADTSTHWNDIAMPARTHFQKRLCLLGPESAGKTELAEKLAAHFRTDVMPEYGRAYDIYHKQGVDGGAKGVNWTEADLVTLARTHIAMREAMAPEAGPILIEDTDIIQTAIWAEFLLGARSPALERLLGRADFADHYFILTPEVAWVDDGVRYAGDEKVRRWFFDEALSRVRTMGLPHTVISGDNWETRTAQALAAAEAAFPGMR